MRPGSDDRMMERRKDRDSERSEVQRGRLRRMSELRADCGKKQSLWEQCNRIYCAVAIIQLSSYQFKPMLLGVG